MHLYTAEVQWERGEQPFTDNRYSRAHEWAFDQGADEIRVGAASFVALP